MKQLSLNLPSSQNSDVFSRDNFVITPENSAAFNFLEKFFAQQNYSQSQFPSFILQGAEASGKSHMLHIFVQEFAAEFIQHTKIAAKTLQENHFYILENIEEIADEELLFHLINSASVAKAFLIFSTTKKPKFKLKDLSSRVKNIVTLSIANPHPETIAMLLVNEFGRRQIKVSSRITNFISTNVARDYLTVARVVDAVRQFCEENGKAITMKNVKEIIDSL